MYDIGDRPIGAIGKEPNTESAFIHSNGWELMTDDAVLDMQGKFCGCFYNENYGWKADTGGALFVLRKETGHTAGESAD